MTVVISEHDAEAYQAECIESDFPSECDAKATADVRIRKPTRRLSDYGKDVPGPQRIKQEKLREDPEVWLFHAFVTQEEVQHIIELCENRWQRSMVSIGAASELLGSD